MTLPIDAAELIPMSTQDMRALHQRLFASELTPAKRREREAVCVVVEPAPKRVAPAIPMSRLDALMVQFRDDPNSIKAILQRVAAKHDFTVAVMLGQSRVRAVVYARQEAMYRLIMERRHMSYPAIGRAMGMDHSSIHHGVRAYATRKGLPMPDRTRGGPDA